MVDVETIVKDLTGVGSDAVVVWSFFEAFLKFSFDSEDDFLRWHDFKAK